jgi:PAS domain-containing protein
MGTLIRLWRSFVSSGFVAEREGERARHVFFLNTFSLIAFVVMVVFGIENVVHFKNALVGYFEMFCGFAILLNIVLLRYTRSVSAATQITLFVVLAVLTALVLTGGTKNTGIFWLFAFPPTVFFLAGRRGGTFWMAATFGMIGIIAAGSAGGSIPAPYALITFRQLAVSLFVVSLLIYLFERYRAHEELLAAERLEALKTAQRIARMGSWEWEIPKNVIRWSDELYRIFNVAPDAFGARYEAYLQQVHPDDRERVDGIIKHAYADGKPFNFTHRTVSSGGDVRILHSQGQVETDAAGKPIRMFGTAQDVTEEQRTEEALRARTAELEKLNKTMIGREVAMAEMKKRLREAEARQGGAGGTEGSTSRVV